VMAAIPEFIWELSFGIYLIVKGFKPSPILAGVDSGPVGPAADDVTEKGDRNGNREHA
jgi:hypothetical protein